MPILKFLVTVEVEQETPVIIDDIPAIIQSELEWEGAVSVTVRPVYDVALPQADGDAGQPLDAEGQAIAAYRQVIQQGEDDGA